MIKKKNTKNKLIKSHHARLLNQHKEHNRRLKQDGRHSECLSFDQYVKYVFGTCQKTPKKTKTHHRPAVGYRRETCYIPSLGDSVGNALRTEIPEYTGDYVKGIATMHKSNSVPVTNTDQVKDISRMRR